MRFVRFAPLSAVALVLVLVASAAVGKPHHHKPPPKPAFKPKTGAYVGTFTAPGADPKPATGSVGKVGKKYVVQVLYSSSLKCDDGSYVQGGTPLPSPLVGRSFSATASARDTPSLGTATWKTSGSFSSERAFSGTSSKDITAGPNLPDRGSCTTGTVKFSLHKKKG